MTHLRRIITAALLLAALALAAVALPSSATATVPPTVCDKITVKGKRYEIRADRMRCNTAEKRSRDYLLHRRAPKGYKCRTYTGSTVLAFRCEHRTRHIPLFFAVKK